MLASEVKKYEEAEYKKAFMIGTEKAWKQYRINVKKAVNKYNKEVEENNRKYRNEVEKWQGKINIDLLMR